MRLLFVNQVHPDSGLVAGVRLFRFAQELAKRGHRVMVLCGSGDESGDDVETLPSRLGTHDWATPFLLTARDRRRPASSMPTLLRKAETAMTLAIHGGPFWRWRHTALEFDRPIRRLFRPDLCYATFGNLDALSVARTVASRGGIPWVMDIKDPATIFLPRSMRPWLMARFRDAAAVTLNAESQRDQNKPWADADSVVIYSGVESPPTGTGSHDPLHVALVGSVYDDAVLATALRGFLRWRQRTGDHATLHYFGVNTDRVERIARAAGASDGVRVEGQLRRLELLTRCAGMGAVLYVRANSLFHHKLLELAVLGRPIIACPGERDEAEALARRFAIPLCSVPDEDSLASALSRAGNQPTQDMTRLARELSWASVSKQLEGVFTGVLQPHG